MENKETDWGQVYYFGAFIIGILGAIAIFIYALSQWGLLFGLLFGWIPALVGGFILGAIWPLIAGVIALIVIVNVLF